MQNTRWDGRARRGVAATAGVALALGASGVAGAGEVTSPQPAVTTVARFEQTVAPEGIAIAGDGTIYVSTSGGGAVWKLGAGGAPTVEAVLAPTVSGGAFGVLDVAIDADGRLYAAVSSGTVDTQGVWTWLPGGQPTRIRGSERLGFANFVAIDDDGTVYVSESLRGEVWRAGSWSGELELWTDHPWLSGNGSLLGPALPVGANGVAVQDGVVYVANTEEGAILRFAVQPDGSAGEPTVWTTGEHLAGIDGITIGPDGVIYASVLGRSEVLRIGWDTTATVLATAADGLDYNSDVAFGAGEHERSIYAINFSVGELFGRTGGAGPGVVRIEHAAPPVDG